MLRKEAGNGFLFLYVLKRACLPLILSGLAGCASIDSSDYRQVVLVQSIPSGARILDSSGATLGTTPAYVRVRRGHHPRIQLKFQDQPAREIDLHARYRWLDSGATNLILTLFAPVGWGVDWITGNMWMIDDPATIKFGDAGEVAGPPRDPVVAIAPPKGIDIEVSDGLGALVEENLRQDRWNVLDYHETAPIFDVYGSSDGISENKTDRYNLFYHLRAQRVLEGEAILHRDHLELKSQLKDVYTGKTLRSYDWDFTPEAGGTRASLSWGNFYDRYLHFLPNSIFLNLSQYQAKVNIDGVEQVGTSGRAPGFLNTMLDYVSYLSLSHLERPRENVKSHFTIGLVPAVILSSKRIDFNSYSPVAGTTFDRWNFTLGYGGEVGYISRYGFVYFDYIPTVTWTQISFANDYISEKLSRWSGTALIETGYSYFITHHLVAKLFVRTLNEDTGLWRKALQDAGGNDPQVSTLSSVFTGFAIGYYFPSTLQSGDGWRLVSHDNH